MAFSDDSSSVDSDPDLEDDEKICPATNLNRELLNAAHNGNLMRAQRLLEAGADINYNEYQAFNLYTPVCLAIQFNHVDMLSWLLQQPAVDVQEPCCVGTPLVLACQEASLEIINLLLENGAHDSTAIVKAKNMKIIDCLLQHGADINATNSNGSTLLHSACNSYRDQVGMVTKLLERGANANARNQDGQTPLFCAASHSHVNIAKLLLEQGGVEVDASDNRGNTPLLESHNPTMMALLLEKGANVNTRDKTGATKLHDICYMMESRPGASFANVTLLVQAGIDLNAKNDKGETALVTAIHNSKQDLVSRLLQEGADPNVSDHKGWTALHVASHCGGRTHLMDPLFEAGINVNAASDNGMTALHVAVRNAWLDDGKAVRKLLEHRADANATTQNGSTPLGMAILGQFAAAKVVEMLLEHGANVNAVMSSRKEKADDSEDEDSDGSQDSEGYDEDDEDDDDGKEAPLHAAIASKEEDDDGKEAPLHTAIARKEDDDDDKETPLHAAIARKHQDISLLLLNSGADTDTTNARGETPLLQASKFGLVRVVACLLTMGVNVDVSSGETPMDVASQGGHADVINLLLPYYVF